MARIRGIIYAYSTQDPISGKVIEWSYVGQTRRELQVRHREHILKQPWSDLDPQVRVIKEFKSCYPWFLNLAEKYYIKTKKPIYNQEYNFRNKHRIPLLVAKQQRRRRDLGIK